MTKQTPSLNVNILTEGAIAIASAASAVVAIVATSYDASGPVQDLIDDYFPLNQLTLVSNYREALDNVGASGTLKNVLTDFAQISAPKIIVIRVESSDEDPANDAAIVAAIDLLNLCQGQYGFTPDYIGAPGLESTLVVNKLDTMGKAIDAAAYAANPAADKAAALTFASGLSGDGNIKILWPDFIGYTGRIAAIALAMRAAITTQDTQMMGLQKTLGNVAIPLVTGLTTPVSFSLSGATGDAKALNEAGITTAVYFENSWRFWGDQMRNGTFESHHLINLALKKATLAQEAKFISYPMTKSLIKNVMENINELCREFKRKGRIIGFEVLFDESANTAGNLSAGQWQIDVEHTPTSPAMTGVVNLRQTTKFYSTLAKEIAA